MQHTAPYHTATCCIALQHTATHSTSTAQAQQHTATHSHSTSAATHCSALQHTAEHCNTLQNTATHNSTPQHTAQTMQHTTLHRIMNTTVFQSHHRQQHTATHCKTLQHTAAHCNTRHQSHHRQQLEINMSINALSRCTNSHTSYKFSHVVQILTRRFSHYLT